MQINSRFDALQIIQVVLYQQRTLVQAFAKHIPIVSSSTRGKGIAEEGSNHTTAQIKAYSFGVLRYYYRLAYYLEQLLTKPIKAKHADIYCLLLLGAYQLLYGRSPAYAIIDETVALTARLKKPWAKGLVNGVLRALQRQQMSHSLPTYNEHMPQIYYLHPQWLIEQIRHDWPQHWQAILRANNQQPPQSVRVNLQKIERAKYLALLTEHNMAAKASSLNTTGVILTNPVDAGRLPGFAAGQTSVQDLAAQLAIPLLDLQAGQCVLDACAAPGGKTCHIAEQQPDLSRLVAVELSAQRQEKIKENCSRLGVSAELICADAKQPDMWWDGQLFDRILLDAPCSATGVIRRHPDIKYLRTAPDVDQFAQQQLLLLHALWPLLKTGGVLLYVTCSVLAVENDHVIARFLQQTPEANKSTIEVDWGILTHYGRQVLPGDEDMDGFFFAKLVKRTVNFE